MKDVARPRRTRPTDLAARTDDAAGDGCAATDQESHGNRCRVPAAGGQTAKQAGSGGIVIEMKWLRIELRGKALDLRLVQSMTSTGKALSNPQVVPVERIADNPATGFIRHASILDVSWRENSAQFATVLNRAQAFGHPGAPRMMNKNRRETTISCCESGMTEISRKR